MKLEFLSVDSNFIRQGLERAFSCEIIMIVSLIMLALMLREVFQYTTKL